MSITASDFAYVCDLVKRRAAIVLTPGKDYLVEARLGPIAKTEGLRDISDLVGRLRAETTGNLHARVVEALTTNETSFFRDVHPFELLRDRVLPEVIARKHNAKRLEIWSAACSTGQEPYTIALTLAEHFPELRNWSVRILATDLSETVLERAKSATFKQLEVNRGMPAALLVKYFQRSGVDWCLKPEITQMVEFKRMNLIDPWPSMPRFDVVFMRNVLIYFDVETKREVLVRTRNIFDPNGYLFLGGAESTINIDDRFTRAFAQSAGCYRMK